MGFKYDVSDKVRLFTQAMYGVSESNQYHERGLPHLQDIWFGTIYSGNPYLPAQLQQAMTPAGRRGVQDAEAGSVHRREQLGGRSNRSQRAHDVHVEPGR